MSTHLSPPRTSRLASRGLWRRGAHADRGGRRASGGHRGRRADVIRGGTDREGVGVPREGGREGEGVWGEGETSLPSSGPWERVVNAARCDERLDFHLKIE